MFQDIEKKYTLDEKLKIINNSPYIKIVRKAEKLKDEDVYISIKRKGKTVYIVAEK